jgi:hypothetical protein
MLDTEHGVLAQREGNDCNSYFLRNIWQAQHRYCLPTGEPAQLLVGRDCGRANALDI